MRLCIPTADEGGLEARVSSHFGRAPYLTYVEVETGAVETRANGSVRREGGPCGAWQRVLADPPEAVVCRGMGGRALARLKEAGVAVFRAEVGTVAEVVEAHRRATLEPLATEAACHGGGHH